MREPLLTVEELCRDYHLSPATLYNLRNRGEGPPCLKAGRRLLFHRSEVEDWARARAEESRQ